ncbi:MAG: hypothetical protein QXE12_01040 [Conexivisphaerales archaeon]
MQAVLYFMDLFEPFDANLEELTRHPELAFPALKKHVERDGFKLHHYVV